MPDIDKKNQTKHERIKALRRKIRYEKRKIQCCAYGKTDIYYLISLEEQLHELLHGGDEND